MKFSVVLLFALGVVAAVIPEESPVEIREVEGEEELLTREEPTDDALFKRQCSTFTCLSPVRIEAAACRCSQRSPCALYACRAGARAYCGSGVTRCVRA
ncbi:hypothetical protein GGTG_07343 [Gaeumannomyces tritici R3-111a-1]|uniref:Invertebrate defensins family profile domain-containing protein n=1 Tax=Gaeumannomyces tritici (strain R3-111a-1) TaxID=644352 RepID=J3P1E6_GAET3|nr:hypothetical protein GGTG_07343 [Gaeumannomyces tritici R3-111a-1]EJT77431.1 hypothetical protein GGTG_07343 [Gaeumannomyces tritici R3-111a-1]